MSDNILHQWARHIINVKKIRAAIIEEADFKKGDRVMDVGCGTGDLLAQIHHQYAEKLEYTGVEPDEKFRAKAESQHGNQGIRFKRAFAHQLPSVQDHYSVVICMTSFHHFPREQWKPSLMELHRILAPGGRLIIVDFGNPEGMKGWFLWLVNTCKSLSKDLQDFLRTESGPIGLKLIKEKQQFGYITHLIFTK